MTNAIVVNEAGPVGMSDGANPVGHRGSAPSSLSAGTAGSPESDFLFDLESQLYEMEALSTTLETLLVPVTRDLADIDRGTSAAIDYAVIHLADQIRALSERYSEMRWPNTPVAAA